MNRPEPNLLTDLWPVGRMCTPGCATTLARSMGQLGGVASANANFAAGTLKVSYDPTRLSPDDIADAIAAEGFACGTAIADVTPLCVRAASRPCGARACAPGRARRGDRRR